MSVFGDEDLVQQILSVLPPKTLMRFKCVSKKWYVLITRPTFVAKHLYNSIHNNFSTTTSVVLKRLVHTNETEKMFSLLNFHNDNDHDDDIEHSFLSSVQDIHIPLCHGGESIIIKGHCNGIICVAQPISGEVILCNPAVKEFKLLPSSPNLSDFERPCCPLFHFSEALGFGYDPDLKEYKVVNIGFPSYDYNEIEIYDPPKAGVHTLGTGSWREIKTDSLETETTILWPVFFQMHFKDMCYWLGYEQHKELYCHDAREEEFIRHIIVLFDTRDELFYDMMFPILHYTLYGRFSYAKQ